MVQRSVVTSPLITKSDGSKFGKSEGQNVWLDADKTSPYEFYQFFFNIADDDVVNMLKRLSMKSVEEIKSLAVKVETEPHLREAQRALAEELTELVHGREGLKSALNITRALFDGKIKELTSKEIRYAFKDADTIDIEEDILLIDVLVNSKAASSKREAREFINNGSISINGERCTALDKTLTKEDSLDGETIVIRKGKKSYFIFKV